MGDGEVLAVIAEARGVQLRAERRAREARVRAVRGVDEALAVGGRWPVLAVAGVSSGWYRNRGGKRSALQRRRGEGVTAAMVSAIAEARAAEERFLGEAWAAELRAVAAVSEAREQGVGWAVIAEALGLATANHGSVWYHRRRGKPGPFRRGVSSGGC